MLSSHELARLADTSSQHPNQQTQAFANNLILFPAECSGEDAFYDGMRLFDWQTKSFVRKILFPHSSYDVCCSSARKINLNYIECEWTRGLLPNSQTFFTTRNLDDDTGRDVKCFFFLGLA